MATKQINDFDEKLTPLSSDSFLLQSSVGTTQRTTLASITRGLIGFFNYEDTETSTTPISLVNGVETKLTNDTLGAETNVSFAPSGVTKVWKPSTNQLDFSELKVGDMVDIRVNAIFTTTVPNQEGTLTLVLGIGGTERRLTLAEGQFKNAGSFPLGVYSGIFMADANILNNPGEFKILTDATGSLVIDTFYFKVIRV